MVKDKIVARSSRITHTATSGLTSMGRPSEQTFIAWAMKWISTFRSGESLNSLFRGENERDIFDMVGMDRWAYVFCCYFEITIRKSLSTVVLTSSTLW